MSLFSVFEKNNINNNDVDKKKLDVIASMYSSQVSFFKLLERFCASGVLDVEAVSRIQTQINFKRQSLQDRFLINKKNDETLVNNIETEFKDFLKTENMKYSSMEKKLPSSSRAINISNYFESKFTKLLKNKKLSFEDIQQIKSQTNVYKEGLSRSFNDENIRDNLKESLLHDLLDDFYTNMNSLYSQVS